MTAQEVVQEFVRRIETADVERLAALYTDDALLDAHVPDWRFQVQGAGAVAEKLAAWFLAPGTVHELQVQQTTSGDVLVRFEWRERDGTRDAVVSREMQLWRLAHRRIAEQVVFCSGRWDTALVERMATEAPLVRELTAPAQDAEEDATRAAIERFDAAFASHDVEKVMDAMTDDCVFEDTAPPDGGRHEGRAAVRQCWEKLFGQSAGGVFDTEELVVSGDRGIARWLYRWPQDGGGHVRGVDVFRVRDHKVAEKYSYVKG